MSPAKKASVMKKAPAGISPMPGMKNLGAIAQSAGQLVSSSPVSQTLFPQTAAGGGVGGAGGAGGTGDGGCTGPISGARPVGGQFLLSVTLSIVHVTLWTLHVLAWVPSGPQSPQSVHANANSAQ